MVICKVTVTNDNIVEDICSRYNKISSIRRNPCGSGVGSPVSILEIYLEDGTSISVNLNGRELEIIVYDGTETLYYLGRQDGLVDTLMDMEEQIYK